MDDWMNAWMIERILCKPVISNEERNLRSIRDFSVASLLRNDKLFPICRDDNLSLLGTAT